MQLLPGTNIRSLTGMRFWAALLVALFHFAGPGASSHNYLINGVILQGGLGVDLFFVLSGYIIHHVYRKTFATRVGGGDYFSFLSYRIARMYPVHIFTLGLMYALYFAASLWFDKTPPDAASYQLPALLQNLLLLHAWFGTGSPNIPAWSISAEWFMYLLYPLVCVVLVRAKTLHEALALCLCLVCVHFLAPLHPLLHILPEFIFGATLYQLNARLNLADKLGGYSGYLLAAAIIAALSFGLQLQAAYVLLFGLLILSLTADSDYLGQRLSGAMAVYLGEISYSLYMSHSFVWSALKNTVRQLAPEADIYAIPLVLTGVALSLLAAALIYHAIEVPGRIWIRNKAKSATVGKTS